MKIGSLLAFIFFCVGVGMIINGMFLGALGWFIAGIMTYTATLD